LIEAPGLTTMSPSDWKLALPPRAVRCRMFSSMPWSADCQEELLMIGGWPPRTSTTTV